jgi:polar amino acid transport system permease protein
MVFCLGVLVFMGLFYYASQKIEYVWRWNRTPIYFAYQDDIDITSNVDGEVASIVKDGDTVAITVKGIGEEETYEAPADSVRVTEGEFISPGHCRPVLRRFPPHRCL